MHAIEFSEAECAELVVHSLCLFVDLVEGAKESKSVVSGGAAGSQLLPVFRIFGLVLEFRDFEISDRYDEVLRAGEGFGIYSVS